VVILSAIGKLPNQDTDRLTQRFEKNSVVREGRQFSKSSLSPLASCYTILNIV